VAKTSPGIVDFRKIPDDGAHGKSVRLLLTCANND
jgi:hypothetical protein